MRHNGGSGGIIHFHTTNTHSIGNEERENRPMTDISHSSGANFQTRNTDRNYKDVLRATDTDHIPAHIDRGISGKNVSGHKITNPYLLDHDDADLFDPGEESLSSDTEVVISRTSQNVHRSPIKPASNECTKKREINSHHTATEVALCFKTHAAQPEAAPIKSNEQSKQDRRNFKCRNREVSN